MDNRVLYYTGQNGGLGDILKGLSSIKHLSYTLDEIIELRFILKKNGYAFNTILELNNLLQNCDTVVIDVDFKNSIDDDIFLVTDGKKPEILYTSYENFKPHYDRINNFIFIDSDRLEIDIETKYGINRENIFSFRYTPLPYWKFKTSSYNKNSKQVTYQFNRYKYKGLSKDHFTPILDYIKLFGYDLICVDNINNLNELVKVMSSSKFHVSVDSGTSHVAHSLGVPSFIITDDYGTNKMTELYHSIWAFSNHCYSLVNFFNISKFTEIDNFDDEIERMKKLQVFLYENDLKYFQVFERMRFEYQHFINRKTPKEIYKNDLTLLDGYIKIRER